MANFAIAAGYNSEKLHTGMLAYMCELYNEGKTEFMESFFRAIGLTEYGPLLEFQREYNRADFAIFDKREADAAREPLVLIEVKVDSQEHFKKGGWQTKVYKNSSPNFKKYVYLTLGVSSNYIGPRDENFVICTLDDLIREFKNTHGKDPLVLGWYQALEEESKFKADALTGNRSKDRTEYDPIRWNLYVLTDLMQAICEIKEPDVAKFKITDFREQFRLGVSGRDTILGFTFNNEHPFYLEINENGKFNLKAGNSEGFTKAALTALTAMREDLLKVFDGFIDDGPRRFRENSKSCTLIPFDIGMEGKKPRLYYKSTRDEVATTVLEILNKFDSLSQSGKLKAICDKVRT